ncbi:MAG: Fe-S cluster assembly protein SufD [Betaproteobacteria bacterium]|jgi:Fe-S cluster assembly protein SufD|nr:Fe-S cluster assembly protein SufD [Betaproteobacteria bacterium]
MTASAGIPFPALGTTALPPAAGAAWLAEVVEAARAAAARLPVPTPRDEAWRFTDIAQIARQSYVVDTSAASVPDRDALAPLLIEEATDARLVFVDGVFAPGLSATGGLPQGVRLHPLSALFAADGANGADAAAVRAHLARHAPFESDFFSALNTARLSDGAAVVCDAGTVVPGAVHLLFLSTGRTAPLAVHPRLLVVAGAGSELTLVEEHASLGESIVFSNAVAECVVGANASLRHVRLQRENRASFHVGRCAASVARDGRYASVSLNIGARLSRLDLAVTLDGEGAQAHLDGLALIEARQHSDTHTLLDHAKPNGTSRQLHKCVCDGAAHAVFNGRILVRPDAQRTDSAQQSRGLLLSPKAQVNAKPQLEIFADDVKAAHGATVGQLDGDELFYLASRGLPLAQARKLLTYAFAAEVIERIPVRSLVARLAAQVMARSGL